jgi:putative tryptophan/tyrosine transport system substrate-binding protein
MRRRQFIAGLGSAAVWPLAAQAQRPPMPVIGFLSGDFPRPNGDNAAALRQGLAEAGYVEGRNVAIEYRWANGQRGALRPLAEELVHRPVDVIFAPGPLNQAARAAKEATSTIPIVFVYGADPVKDGLVASLNRPGNNITGVTSFSTELGGKRLSILRDVVPRAMIFAFLEAIADRGQRSDIFEAAQALGRQVIILGARDDHLYEAAFKRLIQGQARGLVVGGFFFPNTNKILALAAHHKIPTIYTNRASVEAGGLMSYGPIYSVLLRQAGIYAGRILKGEKPADLPVVQSAKFEFVINLKTAEALGIEVPPHLLAIADEVIQ